MEQLLFKLNQLVAQWHIDRDTVHGSTIVHQYGKLSEEIMGELADAIYQDDMHALKDAIGDAQVVLNCIIQQVGYNPNDVLILLPSEESMHTYHEVLLHLVSAFGNLFAPIARGKSNDVILEAIQVVYVNLVVLAERYDLCPVECYRVAWEGEDGTQGIQHRKGKMINNIFVKEDDL